PVQYHNPVAVALAAERLSEQNRVRHTVRHRDELDTRTVVERSDVTLIELVAGPPDCSGAADVVGPAEVRPAARYRDYNIPEFVLTCDTTNAGELCVRICVVGRTLKAGNSRLSKPDVCLVVPPRRAGMTRLFRPITRPIIRELRIVDKNHSTRDRRAACVLDILLVEQAIR